MNQIAAWLYQNNQDTDHEGPDINIHVAIHHQGIYNPHVYQIPGCAYTR